MWEGYLCHTAYVDVRGDLGMSVLSFCNVGSRDQTQAELQAGWQAPLFAEPSHQPEIPLKKKGFAHRYSTGNRLKNMKVEMSVKLLDTKPHRNVRHQKPEETRPTLPTPSSQTLCLQVKNHSSMVSAT